MPSYTQYYDAYGRLYEYEYYQNTSTSNSTTMTLYQQWLGGGGGNSTVVANSPYVIDDWRTWNTSTSTYCTVASNQLWRDWCLMGTATTITQGQGNYQETYQYQLREPTEEERKATEAAKAKQAQARRRAKSLLTSMLTPEQAEYMERHGYIPVLGSRGRRYHVRTTGGSSGNVVLVDDKEATLARFCAHPTCTHDGKVLPTEDSFLAQVLHLQDDEDDFLLKANVNEGRKPVTSLLRGLVPA